MRSPAEAHEWRVEVALGRLLRAGALSEVCSLNHAWLSTGSRWRGDPEHVYARIHVPDGPRDETSAAAVAVVLDVLGDLRDVFKEPSVTPHRTLVSHDDTQYVRHVVCLEIKVFELEPDDDLPF